MLVRLDEIRIRKRVRKDPGDLSDLIESIRKNGLINPILITAEKELIAGERRFQAAKQLGWTSIPVIIKDNTTETSRLELEIEENLHRRSLSVDELEIAQMRLKKLNQPGLLKRILLWFKKLYRKFFR